MKPTLLRYWRPFFAGLPLPMLALAASFGVYSFALLFVPGWVAITQAAAFELTYIGLAVQHTLSAPQRGRARRISLGAVATSIIYNTLSGWFHRQPDLLTAAPPLAWLALAFLHGAPLAWVAYLVSDLLLHQHSTDRAGTPQSADRAESTASIAYLVDKPALENAEDVRESAPAPARDRACRSCGEAGLTAVEVMQHGRARARGLACGAAQQAA